MSKPARFSEDELQVLLKKRMGGRVGRKEIPGVFTPKVDRSSPTYKSKTEAAYASYLDLSERAGEIRLWRYEPVRFILAHDCSLTVDFMVLAMNYEVEWHEVKGRKREDAMIKLRMAARLFPWWPFYLIERSDMGIAGSWERTRMTP